MQFTRLRLSGFKSFVEPTELLIEPGLTGVVGPNGCGKSNLLEALRWVMGESSYKSMRASGMDDVIFSGSANRPPRNMAEVTVTLDNSDRTAPAAFNNADTLEISRRIEREAGSAYRINGRDVRAKDVQLLFADASTGARSPSLVRQGQIGELIGAKPQVRRRILEEAAGIAGLHSRRHEAELKLRAAETNLTRLEDVTGQLEVQLASLRRQSRQAARYKKLSAEIRALEAAQLYVQWQQARTALEAERQALAAAGQRLAECTRQASEATRLHAEAAEVLPALREAEAAAAAALQRITIERDGLDAEEQRAASRRAELDGRAAQLAGDLERERSLIADSRAALERVEAERRTLDAAADAEADRRARAADALAEAERALSASEAAAEEAAEALNALRVRVAALERALADRRDRIARLESEDADITARTEAARAGGPASDLVPSLAADVDAARQALADAETAQQAAEEREQALREAEAVARTAHEEARRAADRIATEIRTLEKVLNVDAGDLWPPLIDAIEVTPGYETALGAALGDDLDAPADEAAPVHWRQLPDGDLPPLPDGAEPLSAFVRAPAALARRLAATGVVSRDTGRRLQDALRPGQRLVSRDGDLWRWDGFTAASEAPTAAARRLAQRNELGDLRAKLQRAEEVARNAEAAYEQARAGRRAAADAVAAARAQVRSAGAAVQAAQDALSRAERAESEANARLAALQEAKRRVAAGLEQARAEAAEAEAALAAVEPAAPIEARLEALRQEAAAARARHADARAERDAIEREAAQRAQQVARLAGEADAWRKRADTAERQAAVLEQRAAEVARELAGLADLPDQFAERRRRIVAALDTAERERARTGDAVVEAEAREADCARSAKAAEQALGEAREEQARTEERTEAARLRHAEAAQRIAERLHCRPEEAAGVAGIDGDGALPALDEVEAKLERLRLERERLGGVNLRAEEEAEEVAARLDGLVSERDDLIAAIRRLRQGIANLNREGRERLLGAFETVNANFAELFTTLFGGGQAELALTEADDPLEAGLEIVARPPGKRTQVISLLSGGEQALTAMALIFAVFLTNPSPICVLDEVDAPLDDANVERFCNLLDAMVERTHTRFLIITHHPLTMARVNRLFGVTMAERGVSQLVSVDLGTAEQLREAV